MTMYSCVLCNAGHFDREIDMEGLREIAVETREQREHRREQKEKLVDVPWEVDREVAGRKPASLGKEIDVYE